MKRIIIFLFLILLLVSNSFSKSQVYADLDAFVAAGRTQIKTSNTSKALSDASAYQFAQEALLWTSVDIGGVEVAYTIDMVNNQSFYALPDSVVEILYVTYISGTATKSIKAWSPETAEDVFGLSVLSGTDESQTPKSYNYHADSIQLIPAPVKTDSIIVKCLIQHPIKNGVEADSTLKFKPAYSQAALMYFSFLANLHMRNDAVAQGYLAIYDRMKVALRDRYKEKYGLATGTSQ